MKTPEIVLPDGVSLMALETADQVAERLAQEVEAALARRLTRAERVSLVVSGGSTPKPFFRALSERALDWRRVVVSLADERWVDENDPASNAALVRATLLRGAAASATFLPLKHPGETPEQGLAAVVRTLESLPRPIDALVLGMGNDGHTASLFPDAPELVRAMATDNPLPVAAMTPASQPHPRITMTYPVLSAARFAALLLRGEDKLQTLAQAAEDPDAWDAMPIRAFLKPGLKVFWSP